MGIAGVTGTMGETGTAGVTGIAGVIATAGLDAEDVLVDVVIVVSGKGVSFF